jgi:hypothetical protein
MEVLSEILVLKMYDYGGKRQYLTF